MCQSVLQSGGFRSKVGETIMLFKSGAGYLNALTVKLIGVFNALPLLHTYASFEFSMSHHLPQNNIAPKLKIVPKLS